MNNEVSNINRLLGLPENSLTGHWYIIGKISWRKAIKLADKIKYRHEHTNYDDLLRRGVKKRIARKMMETDEISAEPILSSIEVKRNPEEVEKAICNLKRALNYE